MTKRTRRYHRKDLRTFDEWRRADAELRHYIGLRQFTTRMDLFRSLRALNRLNLGDYHMHMRHAEHRQHDCGYTPAS